MNTVGRQPISLSVFLSEVRKQSFQRTVAIRAHAFIGVISVPTLSHMSPAHTIKSYFLRDKSTVFSDFIFDFRKLERPSPTLMK